MAGKEKALKKRILDELSTDQSGVLDRCFAYAKEVLRISPDGKVEVLNRDKLTGKEQILAYLIGKLYAKEVDLAAAEDVGHKELANELGIPMGSLAPWLKALKESSMIRPVKRNRYTNYAVQINVVERVLKQLAGKAKRGT